MNFSLMFNKQSAFAFFTFILSAILILASNTYLSTATNHKNKASKALLTEKLNYRSSINKNALFELYKPRYLALKQSGILNAGNRTNWIDSLEKISSDLRILSLKYTFNKQKPLVSPSILNKYSGIHIYEQNMTLQMQLLHEGDLYDFLNSLNTITNGLFNIRKCSLVHNRGDINSILYFRYQDKNNFSAQCELDWYSLEINKSNINRH